MTTASEPCGAWLLVGGAAGSPDGAVLACDEESGLLYGVVEGEPAWPQLVGYLEGQTNTVEQVRVWACGRVFEWLGGSVRVCMSTCARANVCDQERVEG